MAESAQRGSEIELSDALAGLLAIASAMRDDAMVKPEERRKTEVILVDAGLSLAQVSRITGRKYETVKTTVRRAREAGARRQGVSPSTPEGSS